MPQLWVHTPSPLSPSFGCSTRCDAHFTHPRTSWLLVSAISASTAVTSFSRSANSLKGREHVEGAGGGVGGGKHCHAWP